MSDVDVSIHVVYRDFNNFFHKRQPMVSLANLY